MNDPAIVIKNVRKSYKGKDVLRDVSGEIIKGKIVGLLGRNGEGKTTLFRILLDIIAADGGDVLITGRAPDGSGRIRKEVGYVPERPAFHPFFDVQEVFATRARFFSGWNTELALSTARRLDLDLKTPMRGASKGTLAKVAWICATAHEPSVLLLDEPTSGLDLLVRDSVLGQLVHQLGEEGKTVLISNHHMEELSNILEEVWLLHNGKIVQQQNMEDLRANACRITGRLRRPLQSGELSVFEENRAGDVVSWLVLDSATFEKIRSISVLEQMQREPLSAEKAFKVLLSQEENR